MVAAVVGVVLAAAMLWVVTVLISNRTVRPKGPFEADELTVGRASALVDSVPFPLQDPLGRGRHVFVQHLGADATTGWLVFSAYGPDQTDEDCALVWRPAEEVFRDPCSEDTFPADGRGLRQYPTRVDDDDRLFVDLSP